ncbi:uncharacterized protein TRUGW13939_07579 [Talaromyces rugulosus]|uniref:DUF4419 domain-containing protein n=1 Tax=Talaromyces rugulosus TaxID=121627 RepID=A0A7H8R232_TALRU|nr:uncharacterized protein TRUGW13939_07579 [Talaromyces rugulosus]QKX60434.1 hypothetical protein TRUGW13939_07579 [Talaromyces rugulosus]
MPITLTTAAHPPRRWNAMKLDTAKDLLKRSFQEDSHRGEDSGSSGDSGRRRDVNLIRTSFPPSLFSTSHVSPSRNGFVWAVFHAYSHHHNLTIRPEDVWFSILTQLSFFVNTHAEELRSLFPTHNEQKRLTVFGAGTLETADFGAMALQMTQLIEENVVDELRRWIMPDFSSTTKSDSVVAAALMMGTLQKYFSYGFHLLCGIPSVTLLGERQDWLSLVKKLDKLHQFGDEPARFAQLLRPILNHFVQSFDSPESPDVLSFWNKCAHKTGGSGPSFLTGWVSVFCFWDETGDLLYDKESIHRVSSPKFTTRNTDMGLDDVLSRYVKTDDIPSGYVSVPVIVDDNGVIHYTVMLAGLVGIQAKSSGAMLDGANVPYGRGTLPLGPDYNPPPATEEPGLDSIQPLSGWWMYEQKGSKNAGIRA